MKALKNFIATLLCLGLLCGFIVTAAATPTIMVSNATAMPGESATIDIKISKNPGIMAMAFCITYDSNDLEYVKYSKGYLSKYTVKDHPDKGHIIFVNDESGDKAKDGTIISVEFKVKKDAKPGKHTIALANNNRDKYGARLHNSFSNSELEYIVPTVITGSITVGETCENSGHKYGKWETVTPADCTNTGTKKHTCVRCQFTETEEVPFTHDFEAEWTVDRAATPTEDGIMTRHCKKCDAVTDQIIFTYQEVEDSENQDDTSSDGDLSSDEEAPSEQNSSADSTSSETTASQNSSQSNSSGNTTSGTVSKPASTPNKNTINNTVGAKNPQSVVENIKDYQQNVKPQVDSTASSMMESSQNETATDNEVSTPDTSSNIDKVDNTATLNTEENGISTTEIIIYIIAGIISIAVIALAALLIIRKNK